MTARVVFIDNATGLVTDSFEYAGVDGEVLDARDLVSMVLGIDADPLVLLEQVETDHRFRRAVLDMIYVPLFQGIYDGRLDAIAAARVEGARDLCRVVESRLAAQAALLECLA